MIEAGSPRAIWLAFLVLVDEILHAFDDVPLIGNAQWRFDFCQYVHNQCTQAYGEE